MGGEGGPCGGGEGMDAHCFCAICVFACVVYDDKGHATVPKSVVGHSSKKLPDLLPSNRYSTPQHVGIELHAVKAAAGIV